MKTGHIFILVNKTGVERMTEMVTSLHNENMKQVEHINKSLDHLLKLQELKLMKELGLDVDISQLGLDDTKKKEENAKAVEISTAQKIVATEMKKILKI